MTNAEAAVLAALTVATAALEVLQDKMAELEAERVQQEATVIAAQHIFVGDDDRERELEEPNPYHGTHSED